MSEVEESVPILVVDDEKEICNTLKELLESEGYESIHTVSSGKEAIERVKKTKYELILLDVRMPGLNGVETLKQIRQLDKKVPIAMITAYEDLDLAKEALRVGAYDYIRKPFDVDYLKASILSKVIPKGAARS